MNLVVLEKIAGYVTVILNKSEMKRASKYDAFELLRLKKRFIVELPNLFPASFLGNFL